MISRTIWTVARHQESSASNGYPSTLISDHYILQSARAGVMMLTHTGKKLSIKIRQRQSKLEKL